jgi:hypothetical protein
MTTWKAIDQSPGYEVSDAGEIRSWLPWRGTPVPRVLRVNVVNGYAQVVIRTNGRRVYRYVHHLVLEAFVGERPSGTECCHANDDALDNRLSNLRWGTPRENADDLIRNGSRRGENSHAAKLREADVRCIRRLLAEGYSQRQIAAMYGVGKSIVGSIKRGEAWSHI